METEPFDIDPFRAIKLLGKGNSEVWSVEREDRSSRKVYARKQFVLPPGDAERRREIDDEIAVTRRLRHLHIIEFSGCYAVRGVDRLYVLLHPAADTSLQAVLDDVSNGVFANREVLPQYVAKWAVCLFHALRYLHDRRVRHKDIKPGNILMKDQRVILADFGISRDFDGQRTSKSEGEIQRMTTRYIAPEMDLEDRRGRAADIWALGCVLVEMCTVGFCDRSIPDLNEHLTGRRGRYSVPQFHLYPFQLMQWIVSLAAGFEDRGGDDAVRFQKLLQLSFLMLDPNPEGRVMARHIVEMVDDPSRDYYHCLSDLACAGCLRDPNAAPSPPWPSEFRTNHDGSILIPDIDDLTLSSADAWAEVKRRWLVEQ